LTNGTSYVFEIAAENANGSSGAANSAPVTPAAPPSSAQVPATPLNVTAVSGDAQATVTWAAPADGGSPITSYTLTARRGSTTVGQWQVQAGTTQRLLTGLTNGASYVFDVTARNAVGDSAPASSNAVTPATVPDAPGSVSAQPGDGQAAVSWNAPADDGGSAITSYAVTPVGPNGALASTSVPAGSSSTVISGLTNGVSYRFSVRAVNAVGSSAAATSAPVTPQWPGPSSVTAAPDNASATVTWLAPVAGGQPVVSYTVYVYRGGSLIRSIAVGSSATTVIVSSLTNGVSYQFAVAANFGGSSTAPSSLSNAVTPFAPPWWRNPPSNPRNVTAVAGIHQATVSWQVPASTGGTPITSYLIVVRDATDNFTLKTLLVSGSTTSAVVTGLQSGLKYRFRVVATNAAGSSPSSGSSKITIL
jgi:titin